jgi:hypothetical protein
MVVKVSFILTKDPKHKTFTKHLKLFSLKLIYVMSKYFSNQKQKSLSKTL